MRLFTVASLLASFSSSSLVWFAVLESGKRRCSLDCNGKSNKMIKQTTMRSWGLTVAGAAFVCGLLFAGCKGGSVGRSGESALDRSAREYVRLAVALGQRDADSLDYYAGPESAVRETLEQPPALRAIREAAVGLQERVRQEQPMAAQDEVRRTFLLQQIESIVSRVDVLLGVPRSFDEETRASFGVVVPASYDRDEIQVVQRELQQLLPGKGNLADRYQAFDGRFIIPAKLVPAVMARAIEACRAETSAHVALPSGESTSLQFVRNKPWSAYSWYKGGYKSVVQVNLDFALTVDRAMNLACHEAYPGHHTYNSIRDAQLVQGLGLKEYSVQPTFSPQSMLSESIAMLALDVAFPEAKRVVFERDVLFPLAGLNGKDAALYLRVEGLVDRLHTVEPEIAREYLDGRLEFERAGSELERAALMAHPEAALLYMNEYRSYVATYTYGRDLVAEQLQERSGGVDEARWKVYAQWMKDDPKLRGMHPEAGTASTGTRMGGG